MGQQTMAAEDASIPKSPTVETFVFQGNSYPVIEFTVTAAFPKHNEGPRDDRKEALDYSERNVEESLQSFPAWWSYDSGHESTDSDPLQSETSTSGEGSGPYSSALLSKLPGEATNAVNKHVLHISQPTQQGNISSRQPPNQSSTPNPLPFMGDRDKAQFDKSGNEGFVWEYFPTRVALGSSVGSSTVPARTVSQSRSNENDGDNGVNNRFKITTTNTKTITNSTNTVNNTTDTESSKDRINTETLDNVTNTETVSNTTNTEHVKNTTNTENEKNIPNTKTVENITEVETVETTRSTGPVITNGTEIYQTTEIKLTTSTNRSSENGETITLQDSGQDVTSDSSDNTSVTAQTTEVKTTTVSASTMATRDKQVSDKLINIKSTKSSIITQRWSTFPGFVSTRDKTAETINGSTNFIDTPSDKGISTVGVTALKSSLHNSFVDTVTTASSNIVKNTKDKVSTTQKLDNTISMKDIQMENDSDDITYPTSTTKLKGDSDKMLHNMDLKKDPPRINLSVQPSTSSITDPHIIETNLNTYDDQSAGVSTVTDTYPAFSDQSVTTKYTATEKVGHVDTYVTSTTGTLHTTTSKGERDTVQSVSTVTSTLKPLERVTQFVYKTYKTVDTSGTSKYTSSSAVVKDTKTTLRPLRLSTSSTKFTRKQVRHPKTTSHSNVHKYNESYMGKRTTLKTRVNLDTSATSRTPMVEFHPKMNGTISSSVVNDSVPHHTTTTSGDFTAHATPGPAIGIIIGCVIAFWIILGPLICIICRIKDKATARRSVPQEDEMGTRLVEEMVRMELARGRDKKYQTSVSDSREIERLQIIPENNYENVQSLRACSVGKGRTNIFSEGIQNGYPSICSPESCNYEVPYETVDKNEQLPYIIDGNNIYVQFQEDGVSQCDIRFMDACSPKTPNNISKEIFNFGGIKSVSVDSGIEKTASSTKHDLSSSISDKNSIDFPLENKLPVNDIIHRDRHSTDKSPCSSVASVEDELRRPMHRHKKEHESAGSLTNDTTSIDSSTSHTQFQAKLQPTRSQLHGNGNNKRQQIHGRHKNSPRYSPLRCIDPSKYLICSNHVGSLEKGGDHAYSDLNQCHCAFRSSSTEDLSDDCDLCSYKHNNDKSGEIIVSGKPTGWTRYKRVCQDTPV